jgi:hypothetical protein
LHFLERFVDACVLLCQPCCTTLVFPEMFNSQLRLLKHLDVPTVNCELSATVQIPSTTAFDGNESTRPNVKQNGIEYGTSTPRGSVRKIFTFWYHRYSAEGTTHLLHINLNEGKESYALILTSNHYQGNQ